MDDTVILDVRHVLKTDDDSPIAMTFRCARHGPPDIVARIEWTEVVDPASHYFRANPFFETAAPKYDWINRVVAIGADFLPRLPEEIRNQTALVHGFFRMKSMLIGSVRHALRRSAARTVEAAHGPAPHTEFSIIAMIGVILVIGIVKKNAILMIDFALEVQRTQGLSSREAIFRACLLRFRLSS
jgi:AcrB/AcrD/AcrF family/Protein of unknown function (DUF3237)